MQKGLTSLSHVYAEQLYLRSASLKLHLEYPRCILGGMLSQIKMYYSAAFQLYTIFIRISASALRIVPSLPHCPWENEITRYQTKG